MAEEGGDGRRKQNCACVCPLQNVARLLPHGSHILAYGTLRYDGRALGSTMTARRLLVDIHTHVYLPRYANVLRARQHVPRIVERTNANGSKEERLVIFENEPISGRPIGPQYWDLNEKLKFMNNHEIDVSFIRCVNDY